MDRSSKKSSFYRWRRQLSIIINEKDKANEGIDTESNTSEDAFADHLPCLVLARLETVSIKDFSQEIRASLDVEKFLQESSIMLNEEGNDSEVIVQNMIKYIHENIRKNTGESSSTINQNVSFEAFYHEISKSLFMDVNYTDYNYKRLSKTIRGIQINEQEGIVYDPSWICAICTSSYVSQRQVAIARLKNPVNLGRSSEGISFVILIIEQDKKRVSKLDIEVGRTFSTLFSYSEFRSKLMRAQTKTAFKELLIKLAKQLTHDQLRNRKQSIPMKDAMKIEFSYDSKWPLLNGVRDDLKRRVPMYLSDYYDGFSSLRAFYKTVSAGIFLYLSCLLPSIAYGLLNQVNTNGEFQVSSILISQAIGGSLFFLFGGQPLIVLQTSIPISLYYHILFQLSMNYSLEYITLISMMGLFTCFSLLVLSIFDLSSLMRWSTKSTEEIFAFFNFTTFLYYVFKSIYSNFRDFYVAPNLQKASSLLENTTDKVLNIDSNNREISVLYLLIIIGTLWFAMVCLKSTKTPFLNSSKRQFLSDFSMPLSVLIMTLLGSVYFQDIELSHFPWTDLSSAVKILDIKSISWKIALIAFSTSIPLAILIFFDHNITSAAVNANQNKLKKGTTYSWDMIVISVINTILSILGLPLIYGSIAQSLYHVKVLADIDERIGMGHQISQTILKARETRVSGLISQILVIISLFFLFPKPFQYIPNGVLYGLLLCIAFISTSQNQIFERILILFTEQSAYPPSHYLKKVPLATVHKFTFLQILQVGILFAIAFCPVVWVNLTLPICLILAIPMRHAIIPKLIPEKFLEAMDKQ